MRHVAVEDGLTPVADALKAQGYQVSNIALGNTFGGQGLQNVDAVVVSGMHENLLGMHDIQTKAPVINAEGMSADQVLSELRTRLGMS